MPNWAIVDDSGVHWIGPKGKIKKEWENIKNGNGRTELHQPKGELLLCQIHETLEEA